MKSGWGVGASGSGCGCVFAARFELPFGQVVRCHVTAILRPCHFRGRKETDGLGIGRSETQSVTEAEKV